VPVYFNDAMTLVVRELAEVHFPHGTRPLVIRDQYGRIRLAFDADQETTEQATAIAARILGKLGNYSVATSMQIMGRDELYDASALFQSPDIVDYTLPGTRFSIRLLDLQVTGQDWTRAKPDSLGRPQRIVYYGLKGGVGRSTALSLYAYHLATVGKKVVVIDFDLESPGLSSLLLPSDRLPNFGIVDWFVEDAVGQSKGLAGQITTASPMSAIDGVSGSIMVASAMQIDEQDYLSKLSRVFVDVPNKNGGVEHFSQRCARLVSEIENQIEPDVVLIDSRAGLHDIAAVSVAGLADNVLLFGNDTPQTWDAFRLLFSFWQRRPRVLDQLRERFKMVYSLFPESDQERHRRTFIERSYNLFSSTVYEEIEAGETGDSEDLFNFDINDSDAPHFPATINWNPRFLEFSHATLTGGIITQAMIAADYGAFFEFLDHLSGI
jgi:cellulose biosynthesis protein BcsQ